MLAKPRRRRAVALVAVFAAISGSVLGAPAAAQTSGEWVQIIGGTGVLDYTAAQSVAVGPDGSVYVAGHFTESFSADTGITGFDVFVDRWSPEGSLLWSRTLPSFGPGLVDLELDVDGSGNAWLFVDRTHLRLFGAADGLAPPGSGTFPTFDGDPMTIGAAGYDDGFVVAELASNQVRRVELDGSVTWTSSLDPTVATVEVVAMTVGRTGLLLCSESGGLATNSVDVIAANGVTTLSSTHGSSFRVAPGSGVANQDAIQYILWPTSEPVCVGAEPSSPLLMRWSVDAIIGVGLRHQDWESPQTYCLEPGPVSPADPDVGSCAAPSAVDTIDAVGPTEGGVFATRRDFAPDDGFAGIATSTGGDTFVVDAADVAGKGVTTVHRLDPRFIVADMDYGRGGELAVVGTVFPPSIPGPDDPFNAQAFVLREPLEGAPDVLPPIVPPPAPNPGPHPFVDVAHESAEVAAAVQWAWAIGVTRGVDPTHFAPNRTATRAEAGVMLHRVVGAPDVATPHGFVDVVRVWQEIAIRWLKATGVTTGVNPTHFAPERDITRAEFGVMLWRMAGSPFGSPLHPFVDVVAPWQQEAIRWLKAQGITVGVDATHFAPDRPVTRKELVVMLYRWIVSAP